MPEVVLYPVKQWGDIRESIAHYVTRYREECGQCCLELNDTYLECISLLHRAIKHPRYTLVTYSCIHIHVNYFIMEY